MRWGVHTARSCQPIMLPSPSLPEALVALLVKQWVRVCMGRGGVGGVRETHVVCRSGQILKNTLQSTDRGLYVASVLGS